MLRGTNQLLTLYPCNMQILVKNDYDIQTQNCLLLVHKTPWQNLMNNFLNKKLH